MREILFRGKRKDNGEWVYGYYVHQYDADMIYIPCTEETKDGLDYYHINAETVGQFTGLYDKNGKKIFEGDIIRYADVYDYNCYLKSLEVPEEYTDCDYSHIWTIDEVVYGIKIGYPAFDLCNHDFEINGLSELNESGTWHYKVIGNIHDNPELLKGETE